MPPDAVANARAELTAILETTPFGRDDFEGPQDPARLRAVREDARDGRAAIDPLVLGVLDRVLGTYQLSAPTGIEIGAGESAQALHPDDALYPVPRPHGELVVNVMWPLDDFTEANGDDARRPGQPSLGRDAPTARRRDPLGRDARRLRADLPRQPVARRRREPNDEAAAGRGVALRSRLAAAGREPRARRAARGRRATCPSACRSCSATTSSRRSSATSTAATRSGCSTPDASRESAVAIPRPRQRCAV